MCYYIFENLLANSCILIVASMINLLYHLQSIYKLFTVFTNLFTVFKDSLALHWIHEVKSIWIDF